MSRPSVGNYHFVISNVLTHFVCADATNTPCPNCNCCSRSLCSSPIVQVGRSRTVLNSRSLTQNQSLRDLMPECHSLKSRTSIVPEKVTLHERMPTDVVERRENLGVGQESSDDLRAKELEVRTWLKQAFAPAGIPESRGICPDRWGNGRPCREFHDMYRRIALTSKAQDDYRSILEEELSALARSHAISSAIRWYRTTCNMHGCILAVAASRQELVPSIYVMTQVIEEQLWAQDFDRVLPAGCSSCTGLHWYFVVMPSRPAESASGDQRND